MKNNSNINFHERLAGTASVADLRSNLRNTVPGLSNGLFERIAIVGAGAEGMRLAQICNDLGIKIEGVFDANAQKRGNSLLNMKIYPIEALTRMPTNIPIIVASHRVLGACENFRSLGYQTLPVSLLQVAIPDIFSPHEFYKDIYEDMLANKEEYLSLYNLFSDDLSRQTLDALIGYRFTFDPLVLKNIIDWDLYGTIPLEKNEVYVDAGAYTGDSINIFKEHVQGSFSKIYGFEPDSKSFVSLSNRFLGDEKIILHNSGLYSSTKELFFSESSDRSSKIQESGLNKIHVVKLDEVVAENEKITFIKMNIEGAEMDALEGARETIVNWKPKLAISAYHKASDLRNICKKIKEFNKDYKLYLRQHDAGIIESVVYAHLC